MLGKYSNQSQTEICIFVLKNVEPENKIDIARLNFIAVKTEFV